MRAWFSLFALPLVVSANAPAAIFLQPNPAQQAYAASTPALTPYEANSVLANFFGLQHQSSLSSLLEDAFDEVKGKWGHLMGLVHPQGKPQIAAGVPDVIMLLVESDHPKDFLPSTFSPSFSIPDAPPLESFTNLMHKYIDAAHTIFDSVVSSIFHSHPHASSEPSTKPFLDVFDLSPSESVTIFTEELDALVRILEAEDVHDQANFAALNLEGLSKIEEEHGRQSEVYQTAAKSVQAVLSHPRMTSRKLALIVTPSASAHSQYTRAAAPSIPPHGPLPVWSVGTCYESSAVCTNATNSCSGRGSCVGASRAGRTCFSCVCGIAKDEKTGKNEAWAGATCEKKDVSVPFALLAGSTLFLILVVVGSVQLLYSVGEGILPNTLTSTSTAHLKRE